MVEADWKERAVRAEFRARAAEDERDQLRATLASVTAERDAARKEAKRNASDWAKAWKAWKERDHMHAAFVSAANERDALRERVNAAEIALGIGWENLLRISDENAKEAEEAEARVKELEGALRKYVDKTACSVALLSRNGAVGPTLRAELAEAEAVLLGPVAAALRNP